MIVRTKILKLQFICKLEIKLQKLVDCLCSSCCRVKTHMGTLGRKVCARLLGVTSATQVLGVKQRLPRGFTDRRRSPRVRTDVKMRLELLVELTLESMYLGERSCLLCYTKCSVCLQVSSQSVGKLQGGHEKVQKYGRENMLCEHRRKVTALVRL